MDSLQKQLPYSIDAEQSVLGSIIIDPECFDEVGQIVKGDDFYLEVHREIYGVMQDFKYHNRPIDLVTLVNALVSGGIYEDEAAARSYIKLLVDVIPTSANAKDYAKIVYDKSVLRRLIEASEQIQRDAFSQADTVENIVDVAEQRIFEIASKNEKRDFVHIKDVIVQTYNRLSELQKNQGEEATGIKTGFSDLDKCVVGFGKGDLIIVGARPGVGKTSFCLNLATNIAKRSKKAVCIFSLEMSSEQLVSRIISSEAMVDSQKLRTGQLDQNDWEKIANAASILSETNIYIDDTTDVSLTAMKAKLRRIKNLGLVLVDYLQLMESDKGRKDASRVNEIGDISRGLKILAKELNVPVITCSQLSRGTEKEKKKPVLSDLRDSGSIEQDADMVMFLSRDYYGEDPEKSNLVEVIVAKNRHGGLGNIQMSWLGQYTKFSTLDTQMSE
ncbi:MAG: replicative DNA helicase [Clostridia bacterium]|nr:replicative DNA helicase [Clostridia bacterium]MBQ7788600.1 replicative DNA helicase [Clostridia bacterium]